MREHKVEINRDKCIGCGMCQRDCPAYNIVVENKKAAVKTQSCNYVRTLRCRVPKSRRFHDRF